MTLSPEPPARQPLSRLPESLDSGLRSKHIPSLDGLRAIAALLVVADHAGIRGAPGGLGVLAFFVLSGFLITWLLLHEERRAGAVSLRLFYIRRSLRIFPAFYVYWLLLNGLQLALHRRIQIPQAICSFFYIDNYYQAIFGDPSTGLSHTWSLGVEEQFYLLWPFCFVFVKSNAARVRFLAITIGALWMYREALVFVVHRDQGYIYEAFDTRADHLLIGCLLAVLLSDGRCAALWRALCAWPGLVWVTLGALCGSAAIAVHVSPADAATYRDAVAFVIDPLLIVALIVQTVAHPGSAPGVLLNLRWVRYLGSISYSIYLYQQLTILPVQKLTAAYPLLMAVAVPAVVIAVASGSYFVVEKPFLRLKRRFSAAGLEG